MKKLHLSKNIRGRLHTALLQGRRDTVYKMIAKKHNGVVPCFVCGLPVEKKRATLEHIIELSKGGTDEMTNLSISHAKCNSSR